MHTIRDFVQKKRKSERDGEKRPESFALAREQKGIYAIVSFPNGAATPLVTVYEMKNTALLFCYYHRIYTKYKNVYFSQYQNHRYRKKKKTSLLLSFKFLRCNLLACFSTKSIMCVLLLLQICTLNRIGSAVLE